MVGPKLDARRAWEAALGELQLQMTKATFDTWMKDTSVIGCENSTFLIGVSNGYAKDWLEHRLAPTIKRTLAGIVGGEVEVQFAVRGTEAPERKPLLPLTEEAPRPSLPSTSFNSRYTFDNFIVGPSNRLAHAASLAVAERPGQAYNPLFLYGGVGLGKTHLLHAIGHLSLARNPGMRVLYVSFEEFMNDLIESIRKSTTAAFRHKYRQMDVLLVDDIQFIAGREGTQEEFFHTFNTLHSTNKQIVISSDRHPSAIPTLEERLRSRFIGGLIADIQAPDVETRVAILRAKSEGQPSSIPSEALDYIARQVTANIRDLEGALNRVVAYAETNQLLLTVEVAAAALQGATLQRKPLSTGEIVRKVAHYYGITIEDLLGSSRTKHVALPRQVAMYLLREETSSSLPDIGDVLGGRDHTTVLYGYGKIKEEREKDEALRRQITEIRALLYED